MIILHVLDHAAHHLRHEGRVRLERARKTSLLSLLLYHKYDDFN